jgi:fructokinase
MAVFGGIEAGGTKFNLLIASGPDDIRAELRVATTTPLETLSATVAFFNEYQQKYGEKLAGLGIGSFGPLDLNPKSSTSVTSPLPPSLAGKMLPYFPPLKKSSNYPPLLTQM